MKLTCKSLGETKLLTIGNEYEVINESGNRYTILNDRGIQKNYSKNLFNVVAEIPVAPPVPAKIIINELNIETNAEYDEDDSSINVSIDIKGDNNFNFKYSFRDIGIHDTEISCGISQLTGLNRTMIQFVNLKSNLTKYIEDNNFELNVEINLNDTLKDIKSGVLQDITAEVLGGILLISTNITNNEDLDEDLIELLDEMSVSVNEFNNPNSGNTCKIWNINLNE